MKATFPNGVTAEGTPKEIYEFKKLLDGNASAAPGTIYTYPPKPWWMQQYVPPWMPTYTMSNSTDTATVK